MVSFTDLTAWITSHDSRIDIWSHSRETRFTTSTDLRFFSENLNALKWYIPIISQLKIHLSQICLYVLPNPCLKGRSHRRISMQFLSHCWLVWACAENRSCKPGAITFRFGRDSGVIFSTICYNFVRFDTKFYEVSNLFETSAISLRQITTAIFFVSSNTTKVVLKSAKILQKMIACVNRPLRPWL